MKKLIALFAVTLTLLVGMPGQSLAQSPAAPGIDPFEEVCKGQANATACKDSNKNVTKTDNAIIGPDGIVTKVISLLSIGIGIAAVLIVMLGGLRYVMAGNDSGKINKAKDTILYALIGVGVAIAAQFIVTFVLRRL